MRILQLSFPSGTLAPRSTECITTQRTPKSVPTVGWIRVVLCQRVDSQQLLTQYSVQSWRSFARITTQAPNSLPTADVVQFCPNKSAAGVICNKPQDPKQHHCYGSRYGGGVDRRHAALARCLADVIQSHSGVKVFVEQEVPALTRVVNGQTEHARMDLVFNLNGSVTYLDVSIVAPFSCSPSVVSAASTKPGLMAKRAEKSKFDRYPHINLVPFILETTGRPGPHARKFINYLLRDADNPPIAVRDTWSTIQSVLHSAISKQQLTAAVT